MNVAKKLSKKAIDEKLLKKLVPLSTLSNDRLRELSEKAEIEHFTPGHTLFKRGDSDTKTYYLLSGELTLQLASGQSVSLKADTPAALHPLPDARPRPATAVVKTNSSLLIIDAGLLDILVNYDHRQSYEVNEINAHDESDWLTRFLQSLSAMNIPVKNIEHLMQRMQELSVRAGEIVIRQTDCDSQHYYVIKEGRCVVTKQATPDKTALRIAELTAGIGFGEEALLADQPRNASITMLTDGRLMLLPKADFTQLIADPALHYVTYTQAQQMVQSGAIWLDTRSGAEHHERAIIGSIHIPLMALRTRVKELNTYGKYIAFCDSGNRAAAAAFLLRQMGFSAYVLSEGLRDVPVEALRHHTAAVKPENSTLPPPARTLRADAQTDKTPSQLKPQPQHADIISEPKHPPEPVSAALEFTHAAKAQELREQLSAAHVSEQDAVMRLAQPTATAANERDTAKAEHARMQQRIAELEANCITADRMLANHQQQVRLLQAQSETRHNSVQKELDALTHTHEHVTGKLKHENMQLQEHIAAATTEVEGMKNEWEHAVERNRTAEEALHTAEREIARLQAEADAAQRYAEESLRRASESESLQSTLLNEVQRKIEAANLMRLEAEEQTQRLREAAELSRKRAEQESRKVVEAEAARAKAQDESERRERLTEDIRKKAEIEMARLKKEADVARANADEARKKSQLADAARRRLELEMQTQLAQARAQGKSKETPAIPASTPNVENDLDELERELAHLQQKLEAKKHAAVTRNQQAHHAAEKNRTTEAEIVQNVYDLNQKTQKLPAFKSNQAAPNDVGKVRKSGWISDSILWETTIGLREDSEAEKFLDTENAQRPTAASQPTAKRHEGNTRLQSSGEFKSQDIKRSVFTARESAPTIQRHVDVSGRSSQHIGLITLLSAVAVAIGVGSYAMLHKPGTSTPELTTSIPTATIHRVIPTDSPTNTLGAPPSAAATLQAKEPVSTSGTKSTSVNNASQGAITRKEILLPDPITVKPKAEVAKIPARKMIPAEKPLRDTPTPTEPSGVLTSQPAPLQETSEQDKSAPQILESASPARTAPTPINTNPSGGELNERAQPGVEAAPEPANVVPTFTDAPQVN